MLKWKARPMVDYMWLFVEWVIQSRWVVSVKWHLLVNLLIDNKIILFGWVDNLGNNMSNASDQERFYDLSIV